MGWFDQFASPGQMPGGQGLPPMTPPPDDSPDWYWDGSAWTKRMDEGNGWPGQPGPPSGGPPAQPPPPTPAPPPPTNAGLGSVGSAIGGPNQGHGSVGSAIGGPLPWGAQGGGLPPVLAGWDGTKWANQSHQTHKYKIGRILAKYPPTVEGLKQALPEIQRAYPGAKILGLGDLDLGLGEDPVDVLRGASHGGSAWQWLTTDEAKAGGGVAPRMPFQGNLGNGVPAFSGGFGGGSSGGGDVGGGEWTMPRGSSYQFGGVPGYSGGAGYTAGAFGNYQPPDKTRNPLDPANTMFTAGPGPTRDGVQTLGAPSSTATQPYTAGAFGTGGLGDRTRQPYETGDNSLSTTGLSPLPAESGGAFGTGLISSGVPIPGSRLAPTQDGGRDGYRQPPPPQGGYDHAPSFTPLDPFNAPPAPDAAPEWKGSAFDIGQGPDKFMLPTGQAALEQDPGYQFRLEQGMNTLQNAAAAKGYLRTGGTLKDIQDFGQRAASQEYQSAVDRALAVAGFNEGNRRSQLDLGLRANDQNNRYGLQGAQFNADQTDRAYQNRYNAANQGYAYANQQNLAGNNQALSGYQTDVGRDLGMRGLKITADQNAFMNSLNAQQQQWMQLYMQNGQSFDQAYKMMMAQLQYPA